MNTVQNEALSIAKEVTARFKDEFGYEPIIGGSLGYILAGYIPARYKDVLLFQLNDIDILVEDSSVLEATITNPLFNSNNTDDLSGIDWTQAKICDNAGNLLSIENANYIGNFVRDLRIEVYHINHNLDLGNDPLWVWIDDVKVANPMLGLNAKAGYVISEMSWYGSEDIYQERRNERLLKHYKDIVKSYGAFTMSWVEPAKVKLVREFFGGMVEEYLNSHAVEMMGMKLHMKPNGMSEETFQSITQEMMSDNFEGSIEQYLQNQY